MSWFWALCVRFSGMPSIIDFAYDALNRRIQEIRPSETRDLFYSAEWQLLEEQINAVAVAHYVWSPVYVDALVLRDGADSGDPQPVLYAMQDANFNVTGIVSAASVVLERYVQDPYGSVTVLTPVWVPLMGTLFAWNNYHQGLRFVIDVGLYYNRWRDYSPRLMRFVQVDPIWTTNLYLGLTNNPLVRIDPFGLLDQDHHWFPQLGGRGQGLVDNICCKEGIRVNIHRFTTTLANSHTNTPHWFLHQRLGYERAAEAIIRTSKNCCDVLLRIKGLIWSSWFALRSAPQNFNVPLVPSLHPRYAASPDTWPELGQLIRTFPSFIP